MPTVTYYVPLHYFETSSNVLCIVKTTENLLSSVVWFVLFVLVVICFVLGDLFIFFFFCLGGLVLLFFKPLCPL